MSWSLSLPSGGYRIESINFQIRDEGLTRTSGLNLHGCLTVLRSCVAPIKGIISMVKLA